MIRFSILLSVIIIPGNLFSTVYADFDSNGNFYCNTGDINLEKLVYRDEIMQLNNSATVFYQNHQNSSNIELHKNIINNEHYEFMLQEKACLESMAIDPDSVAHLSEYASDAITIPEFPIPMLLIGSSLCGMILITRIKGKRLV